jgi:hypothetical protein
MTMTHQAFLSHAKHFPDKTYEGQEAMVRTVYIILPVHPSEISPSVFFVYLG